MSNSYHTKNGRTSKRGAFINGVWHCDCDPRLPAEKFQTKNGGKNHGRWFYTCQKPQPKRCPFFLWSDDAKIREESAVMSNSRTEPHIPTEPQTPRKSIPPLQQQTPFSNAKSEAVSPTPLSKPLWSHSKNGLEHDDEFNWSSDGDEELASVAEAVIRDDEESPRKIARTPLIESPGKRAHADMNMSTKYKQISGHGDDIFATPATSTRPTGLLSPIQSHSKQTTYHDHGHIPASLTSEIMQILKPISLPPQIEQELVNCLNRHDLRTQGIIRGRDITRVAVQSKEKKISDLQARITALEAEKETSRTVIAHLKQDFATSPKRHNNKSRFGSKSEV